MTTAHELYERGLRDHLAPALRLLGLTGWRRTFSLPDETHWALLGLVEQRAGDRIRYTFDLSLVRRSDWAEAALPGPRPDPRAVYGIESWRARIGELLPVGEDVWWEVLPGPRWQVALDDSVAAVRHYGLPELRRRARGDRGAGTGETYLSPAELEQVNAPLAAVAVARIQRAELVDGALVLTGAWTRADAAARTVLRGVARGFLSADDERFRTVRCLDSLGRPLWDFDDSGRDTGREADRDSDRDSDRDAGPGAGRPER
ncbi:hypothetical protein [Kitasatospora sp. NBC_00458]|uniref:hypothetical protein n=1 Tax=Kitasatospora sp. NBC_00458 TaxID=2903568 RepID=UPI002E183BA5